jgi:uncharacterized protein RhaS with RHS repeats
VLARFGLDTIPPLPAWVKEVSTDSAISSTAGGGEGAISSCLIQLAIKRAEQKVRRNPIRQGGNVGKGKKAGGKLGKDMKAGRGGFDRKSEDIWKSERKLPKRQRNRKKAGAEKRIKGNVIIGFLCTNTFDRSID